LQIGYRRRRYCTEAECELMWDRWQAGDSLHEIARLLDRGHGAVAGQISRTGGFRPTPRSHSIRSLSLAEREEISRGIVAGLSIRTIASQLGRARSTVSREVIRNGGRERQRGNERTTPSPVNWHRALRWHASWPRSCSSSGLRDRLQGG
jgi:IS30 family transposase